MGIFFPTYFFFCRKNPNSPVGLVLHVTRLKVSSHHLTCFHFRLHAGDWDYHCLDPAVWHVSVRETQHESACRSSFIHSRSHHFLLPMSLQHPVSWQPSKEGDHLIGRITLSKRSAMPREAGSLLGLKVSREWFPFSTRAQPPWKEFV